MITVTSFDRRKAEEEKKAAEEAAKKAAEEERQRRLEEGEGEEASEAGEPGEGMLHMSSSGLISSCALIHKQTLKYKPWMLHSYM